MVTFCHGNEGESVKTINSGGVEICESFQFNNTHVFEYRDNDKMNEKFFRDSIGNYDKLCKFIKDEAKKPVSTLLTKEVLDHREIIASQEVTIRKHCITLTELRSTVQSKLKELNQCVHDTTSLEGDQQNQKKLIESVTNSISESVQEVIVIAKELK